MVVPAQLSSRHVARWSVRGQRAGPAQENRTHLARVIPRSRLSPQAVARPATVEQVCALMRVVSTCPPPAGGRPPLCVRGGGLSSWSVKSGALVRRLPRAGAGAWNSASQMLARAYPPGVLKARVLKMGGCVLKSNLALRMRVSTPTAFLPVLAPTTGRGHGTPERRCAGQGEGGRERWGAPIPAREAADMRLQAVCVQC